MRTRFFGIGKIMPFIRPYRNKILFMIVLGLLSSLGDALIPLFNRYALDHFIAGQTMDGISAFIGLYFLLVTFQEMDNFYCLYECGKVEMCLDRDLRDAGFSHLQTLSFSYFNQNSVGYIHSRIMSDTAKIGEMVAWRMMDIVWNVAYILSILIVMFTINVYLAGLIFVLVPVAVVLILFFQKKLVALNRKIREINARITGNFNEGITGARTIKTLSVEDVMIEDFKKDTAAMYRSSVHQAHHSALLASLVSLLSSVALATVLWQGGWITNEGVIQIGTLSVFMSYAVGMLSPIQSLIATLSSLISIQVNIERFTALLEERSDVADSKEVIEKYGDNFTAKTENWEPLIGDVRFNDVTFMYPDGKENVLEHFSLHVPAGSNVAIVGQTGAGKSTLVNLVCRFYEPSQGQVLIDGIDARERSQLWLHSHIGYVLQTPHLFSGSVRDNLRYAKTDANDEEIWEALRLVSADGIVRKLPQGLDSDVGEGGGMLSTGEKQLLSFTRALLADPKILVLDEATSSVDTLTEKAVQHAIDTIIKGRTSFVIAHRLSTIVDADIILTVQDGKIVEQGTHEELMKKKGYYYRLYQLQFEDLIESD
ncbi:MAG: ABC transporter ATP-binding protein [Erysipelotrichaceae bacterium]|nr:ABC transporter ATP-binding protein [Erysipelotrichaceae bacterium]